MENVYLINLFREVINSHSKKNTMTYIFNGKKIVSLYV